MNNFYRKKKPTKLLTKIRGKLFFLAMLLLTNAAVIENASAQIVDPEVESEPVKKIRSSKEAKSNLTNGKAIFFNGGISGKGYFGKLGSSILLTERAYLNVDFMYEHAKASTFNFSTYNFTATIFGTPFRPLGNAVYINAGFGITGNRASIKKVETDENNNTINLNTIDLGPLVALEIETFLSKKTAWIVSADQRWYLTNNFAKTKKEKSVNAFFVGTGFKFFL